MKRVHRFRTVVITAVIIAMIILPFAIPTAYFMIMRTIEPGELPSMFGYTPVIVVSSAMKSEPKLGDVAFIKRGAMPSEGETAAALTDDGSVSILKVISVSGAVYTLRGDNEPEPSSLTLTSDMIAGIYAGRVRGLGSLLLFMSSTGGIILFIVFPLCALTVCEAVSAERRKRKYAADADAVSEALRLFNERIKK